MTAGDVLVVIILAAAAWLTAWVLTQHLWLARRTRVAVSRARARARLAASTGPGCHKLRFRDEVTEALAVIAGWPQPVAGQPPWDTAPVPAAVVPSMVPERRQES